MEFEQVGKFGYAAGFEGMIEFIMLHTQSGEKRDIKRENTQIYPKIAIREFVANAAFIKILPLQECLLL